MAFVPAATIGWWASSKWLSGFAYRVEINLFIFLIAGLSAMAIAWLTVAYQSIKAARVNPWIHYAMSTPTAHLPKSH